MGTWTWCCVVSWLDSVERIKDKSVKNVNHLYRVHTYCL